MINRCFSLSTQVEDKFSFNMNDRRHELSCVRPAAAFLSKFRSPLGSDQGCWVTKGLVKGTRRCPSFREIDCLAPSVSRSVVLLEDKELVIDLTHDSQ